MKFKEVSQILLILGILISLGCNCRWFETNAALAELYNESDLVLVGRPIRNVNPYDRLPNTKYMGFDILMKVVSVEKGVIKSDTVLILQNDGNCAMPFMPKEKVILFGAQIKNIRTRGELNNNADLGYSDEDSCFYYAAGNPLYDSHKKLHAKYTTVTTNQCISFTTRERLVSDFIRAKRQR